MSNLIQFPTNRTQPHVDKQMADLSAKKRSGMIDQKRYIAETIDVLKGASHIGRPWQPIKRKSS